MMYLAVFPSEGGRNPGADFRIDKVEARRHHAYYCVRPLIQTDDSPERCARSSGNLPAHAVAQDGALVRAGFAFRVVKDPAVRGWNA